ncbi:hypothetical protein GOBAR_AA31088 [Gossypium barbadense]|uniref:Uncharacterized protein n=1 Tax=Gossypium barbadense TaxID=3634 RepID=A0A2P5WER6_GOSBA|nr:hypothetical protein GOBAR_AA31088 [Gossypium barbadense]
MLIGKLCFHFYVGYCGRITIVISDGNISVQDVLDTWLSWKWGYDTSGSLVLQPSLMVTTPHWSPPESGWFKLNTNGAMSLTNQQDCNRLRSNVI